MTVSVGESASTLNTVRRDNTWIEEAMDLNSFWVLSAVFFWAVGVVVIWILIQMDS